MYKAIKLSISDRLENVLLYTALVVISCIFGVLVGILALTVGSIILAEISGINLPFWSAIVFSIVPAIEMFIMTVTDNLDSEAVLVFDVVFWALWIASLAAIGCIENKLKLGLSGFEAFILSLGMPVGLVMIIAFIAFIVICLNKIVNRHVDR